MEILALKLLLTDDSVNRLLVEHQPKDAPVENLVVRLTPEGIRVQGAYPTVFMKVAFESLWALSVVNHQLEVQLADVKVSGFPATMLRGIIFKMLKESIVKEPGLAVDGETLRIDVEQFLAAKGLPLKVNLKSVLCSVGSLVVESGTDGVVA